MSAAHRKCRISYALWWCAGQSQRVLFAANGTLRNCRRRSQSVPVSHSAPGGPHCLPLRSGIPHRAETGASHPALGSLYPRVQRWSLTRAERCLGKPPPTRRWQPPRCLHPSPASRPISEPADRFAPSLLRQPSQHQTTLTTHASSAILPKHTRNNGG